MSKRCCKCRSLIHDENTIINLIDKISNNEDGVIETVEKISPICIDCFNALKNKLGMKVRKKKYDAEREKHYHDLQKNKKIAFILITVVTLSAAVFIPGLLRILTELF